MPNKLLRKKQFENVINALWQKSKEKFVSNVIYKPADRSLHQTINDVEQEIVTGLVTKWEDLDHVEKYSDINLMEYNKKITGYHYGGAGDTYVENASWSTYFLDVEPGKQYSVIGKTNNNNRFVYTETVGGAKVDAFTVNSVIQSNNFYIMSFTVPTTNNRIKKVAISFEHDRNTINDMMIFEGAYTSVSGFVPYADGQAIQIGTDISYAFDNNGTDLKSTTVSSAIKELSEKLDENNLPITNYQPINQFNAKEMVLGRKYDTNGDMVSDEYYATYTHPCTSGQTFTVAKRFDDDDRCVYLTQDNQKVQVSTIPKYTRNGILHYRATVPSDNSIAKIGFNIKVTTNTTQVMIFDGHKDLPSGATFTPYLAEKVLDGDKVLHSFNNVGTNLSSKTTKEAIEELSLSKVDKYTTTFNRHKSYKDFTAKYYRIPSLVATNRGTLLSFADIRYNTAKDQSFIDIGVARSIDDGKMWNNAIAMENERTNLNESRVMDSTSVVTSSGKIIVLAGGWSSGTSNWTTSTNMPDPLWNPFIVESTDDGLSWSDRKSLNGIVGQPPNTVAWLGGVGTGIVKKKGNNIDRIILPIQICTRDANANRNTVQSGCIYSDDDGVNWRMSTGFAPTGTSENMIAEIGNGDLIMIARRDNVRSKGAYISQDGGDTWNVYAPLDGKFTHGTPSCQNSWITLELNGQTIGLLSQPKNTVGTYQRNNITIYMYNFDNPNQGVVELYTVYPYNGNGSGAGYSSLCYYKNINGVYKLAILFESNGNIEFRDLTSILYDNSITLINHKLSELSGRKVDKYTPSFATDLTVENLNITGRPIATIRSQVTTGSAGSRTLAGDKNTFVRVGTKISKIQVGVHGYSEGEKVTGVEVYAVKKADDTIVERIVYEGTGVARIPKGETDGVLYVDVEVNKSFNDEVYFIARLNPNGNKGLRLGGTHPSGIAFDKTSVDQELQQGDSIPIGNSTTKIPNILIYGETSLSNAIVNVELNNTNRLDFKKANGITESITLPTSGGGTGTVSSVNGEMPQPNGDVILTSQVTQTVGQDIVLAVGNQNFATLVCMTDQEATTIIDGFTL